MSDNSQNSLNTIDLNAYFELLSGASSTPGGGAATALTGAQAAALLSMVCNFSAGAYYDEYRETLDEINFACETRIKQLLNLATEDAQQFDALMQVYKKPKSTPMEKERRTAAIQDALKNAADVPLKVMQATHTLLPFADELATIGNKNLITDVGVAVHLIEACLQSARLNVLINIKQIKDELYSKECTRQMDLVLSDLATRAPLTLDKVNALLR